MMIDSAVEWSGVEWSGVEWSGVEYRIREGADGSDWYGDE